MRVHCVCSLQANSFCTLGFTRVSHTEFVCGADCASHRHSLQVLAGTEDQCPNCLMLMCLCPCAVCIKIQMHSVHVCPDCAGQDHDLAVCKCLPAGRFTLCMSEVLQHMKEADCLSRRTRQSLLCHTIPPPYCACTISGSTPSLAVSSTLAAISASSARATQGTALKGQGAVPPL